MIYERLRKRDVVRENLEPTFCAILLVVFSILSNQYTNQTVKLNFDRNISEVVGSAVFDVALKTGLCKSSRDAIS